MQKEVNQHLELGKLNFLRADRLTPHGIFFMAQDGKDVLLPKAYVTDEMIEDSIWELFLYTDSQDWELNLYLIKTFVLNHIIKYLKTNKKIKSIQMSFYPNLMIQTISYLKKQEISISTCHTKC